MADYPTSAFNPATRSSGQTIAASHINDVQAEIRAIQLALISSGLAHHLLFVDATYDIGASGATRPRHLFLSHNATIGGALTLSAQSKLYLDGGTDTYLHESSGNVLGAVVGGESAFVIVNGGAGSNKVFIADSANSKLTQGLTINQGAADNEILALKSSDVAHGVTTDAEADTYGTLKKQGATTGGLAMTGYGTDIGAVSVRGTATAASATRTTAAQAPIELRAGLLSGTTTATVGADKNLVVITDVGTARFIFDSDGSAHGDVEWTTFDTHNDLALLDALDTRMSKRDAVTNAFGEVLAYNADALQEAGIVNFYDDGPRAMVNFTRLAMLHTGALRQLGRQLAETRHELARVQRMLPEAR